MSDSERQEMRRHIKEAVASKDAHSVIRISREFLAEYNKPADVMFCASAFSASADALITQQAARLLRTFVVRSVTVEPILPFLAVEAVLSGFVLDVQVGGYGSYADEMLDPQSSLVKFNPDLVLVLLDAEDVAGRLPALCAHGKISDVEEEIAECLARLGQLLKNLRSRSSARFLVQGFVVPDLTSLGDVGEANLPHSLTHAVQQVNQGLAKLCRAMNDCVFFDVDHLAARHGRAEWRDSRMFLASRLPVSANSFSVYSRGVVRSFAALFRTPRKVLCTDLDNTLWGGILGEDGPDGISTGNAFPGNSYLQYQQYLKQLSSRGILLAIVSKNNESDVREAFQARAADLALTLDDFVATKVNWQDKANSIREIASELSLGLDSFVFVDDNPVECEAIRQELPEVAVIAVPIAEPWKLVEILSKQAFFDAIAITDDDIRRGAEYKAQAKRAELENTAGNRNEFLASLGIVCTFQSALQAPLSRAVQLLVKTNQFNLTTRRRSAAEIEEFSSAPGGQAVVVRAHDRFGDAGVVGLALARHQGRSCYIDSLLLSCRVIGRGIETALLAHLGQHAVQYGATRLVGEFTPTKKNAPCADFYSDHGFVRSDTLGEAHSASVFYELDLTVSVPTVPEWITLEGNLSDELATSTVLSA